MHGLENVIAFDTQICHIDGEAGRLRIRGLEIGEVARLGFERACGLLWFDDPSPERGPEIAAALGTARAHAHAAADSWLPAVGRGSAMAGMRAALACLDIRGGSLAAAAPLTGAMGVLLAARHRQTQGLSLVPPDPQVSHTTDILRMMAGAPPAAAAEQGLSHYLCTVMEHGVNASTFTARTVASTDADTLAAVIAGMCALEGRLHGGAPGPVLDMLDAVGTPPRARAWLVRELDAGRRIMGMGHRVYRARDPRAAVLEGACRALEESSPRITLARAVEEQAETLLAQRQGQRRLRANVEFFTAIVLEALGIPRELFTATFAAARVVGWCAHVEEQRRTGRLIRPRARYIGRASCVAPAAMP